MTNWLTLGLGEYDVMKSAEHTSVETTRRLYPGAPGDLLDRARLVSVAAIESTFGTHLARAPLGGYRKKKATNRK